MASIGIKYEYGLKRVERMVDIKKEMMDYVNDLHVIIHPGNNKTGRECWTSSLIPLHDCPNCSKCFKSDDGKCICYDTAHVCFQKTVMMDRARNSAIHEVDPERYWFEIEMQIRANYVHQFRANVGGDMSNDDFELISKMGLNLKDNCDIMFFTKNYNGINNYLGRYDFSNNMHPLMSPWLGMKFDNPHNLPCAHVLFPDGSTTAPEFGAYFCGGNCSECHYKKEGCWALKKGEHVVMLAH